MASFDFSDKGVKDLDEVSVADSIVEDECDFDDGLDTEDEDCMVLECEVEEESARYTPLGGRDDLLLTGVVGRAPALELAALCPADAGIDEDDEEGDGNNDEDEGADGCCERALATPECLDGKWRGEMGDAFSRLVCLAPDDNDNDDDDGFLLLLLL